MASYKLTTIATFTDNTCSEDPEDLQRYVDDIKEDILSHWDTAEVICDVDGKVYTSKGDGNRREGMGQSRFANHPWHQLKDELPPEGLHVLFYDGAELHMGWASKKSPMGRIAPDGDCYVTLEDNDDSGFYTFRDVSDWWWRKVEIPATIKRGNE